MTFFRVIPPARLFFCCSWLKIVWSSSTSTITARKRKRSPLIISHFSPLLFDLDLHHGLGGDPEEGSAWSKDAANKDQGKEQKHYGGKKGKGGRVIVKKTILNSFLFLSQDSSDAEVELRSFVPNLEDPTVLASFPPTKGGSLGMSLRDAETGEEVNMNFDHGTTTLGFKYQGGVCLAVDSR